MQLGNIIRFSTLGYTILMFRICKKSFFPMIFFIIKVWPTNEPNMDSHNNMHSFHVWALQSCFAYWDTWYWWLYFGRKTFCSTIFLIVEVHLWYVSNLDTHNNIYSFCYWHDNHCSPHWDTQYGCFGFARKAFFPPFSL